MKKEIIQSLTNNFEDHSRTTENGIEFWFARDIQHLLGYSEWRNFFKVITKAKITCEATNNNVSNHFVDVNKTIALLLLRIILQYKLEDLNLLKNA